MYVVLVCRAVIIFRATVSAFTPCCSVQLLACQLF